MNSGRNEHRAAGPKQVSIAIITISDTRTRETDSSGDYLAEAIAASGNALASRHIIKDEADAIRELVQELMASEVQVIITSGGTGIAGRDVTIPVIESLLDKPMPGFGELFRMLSFKEVGSAAMLSRATGGLAGNSMIFALPGSPNAVKTAWEGLIKDELAHMVFEVFRHGQK